MDAATEIDLMMMLERATVEEATAFCVVAVDDELGIVLSTTGPFTEAEAALVQAGRDEALWRKDTAGQDGCDSLRWVVVPQWEPNRVTFFEPATETEAACVEIPDGCTCDPEFFPTALDVECPVHGLLASLIARGAEALGWPL